MLHIARQRSNKLVYRKADNTEIMTFFSECICALTMSRYYKKIEFMYLVNTREEMYVYILEYDCLRIFGNFVVDT